MSCEIPHKKINPNVVHEIGVDISKTI